MIKPKTDAEKFIADIETISYIIANWAAGQIKQGHTITEVKKKLNQITEIANRH